MPLKPRNPGVGGGDVFESAGAKSITAAGAQLNHFSPCEKLGFEQGEPESPGVMDFAKQRPY
jgi:hypothetical protein